MRKKRCGLGIYDRPRKCLDIVRYFHDRMFYGFGDLLEDWTFAFDV